ncbi:PB1 domain [Arabidopsis suecica]|uniref:PB1 domain n=1 Tax=Arabidopsis suecica TaxID=45249 RepID=A0A8T1ZS33_ARASU|nr:PB1 domain [Arabidopsis suecica]KAG7563622.1 PB1 domain [Arabidopsis suecica]
MVASPTNSTIKFLCSYGGKILPRYPDGKLRYNGGHTRVLAVPRSISFSELASKMAEMCGGGGGGGSTIVTIRCQLPMEDLDALVSITSDEDLVNLIEEYDLVSSSSPMKIRVFLNPPKSAAGSRKSMISPPPLALPSSTTSSSSTNSSSSSSPRSPSLSKPPLPPSPPRMTVTKNPCYGCYVHRNSRNIYLVHNGNHWQ